MFTYSIENIENIPAESGINIEPETFTELFCETAQVMGYQINFSGIETLSISSPEPLFMGLPFDQDVYHDAALDALHEIGSTAMDVYQRVRPMDIDACIAACSLLTETV